MRIREVAELEHVDVRALVVNFHTELAATLAVASLRTNAPAARILVVDLDPTVDSRSVFTELSTRWAVDVLEVGGTAHGTLLDLLVPDLRADAVLLLDSDGEIRDPGLLLRLQRALRADDTYGAGFTQHEDWFEDPAASLRHTRYSARFWPVCVLLRSVAVRAARAAGVSFVARTDEDEAAFFDTGADLGRWLERRSWRFASIGSNVDAQAGPIVHQDGFTWQLHRGVYGGEELEAIHERMRRALAVYGVVWDTFGVPPTGLVAGAGRT